MAARDFNFFTEGEIGEAPVNVFKETRYDGETWQVSRDDATKLPAMLTLLHCRPR